MIKGDFDITPKPPKIFLSFISYEIAESIGHADSRDNFMNGKVKMQEYG